MLAELLFEPRPQALRIPLMIAIAAMSQNRVIGCGGKIPWHLPEDFRWFKKMTIGQVLVMGRKTFESIGKPLPSRVTIVLSHREFSSPGVRWISDLAQLDHLPDDLRGREIFICGGAQVYAAALPFCSELYLTLVKRQVEGDAFFPPFEQHFTVAELVFDCADFSIRRYQQKMTAYHG
jgi:dihydrofolate reductase